MIVGTAGHVNHGKTTLVEALTGVACDRLDEERSRGMTIELGFAPWTLPDGRRVSVIDVPGHSKFARTMAAGALGVQVAVLVVAADEGWMPQTREHVAACRVLGVDRAVVALTRVDKVPDPATSVRFVREKLDATHFAGAPIVRVCAPMGEGLGELAARVAEVPDRADADRALPPLLPVDRVFTQKGFGTVITGSLLRGAIAEGDRLAVFPSGPTARVRQVHVHGERVERAEARSRVALNLADLDADDAPRGSVLGAPDQVCVGRVFDAEIEWLAHNAEPLRRARSLGFGQGPARAAADVIAAPAIAPGEVGVGRVHLDRDVALAGGTRFVLRGPASRRHGAVVGGGRILDAAPPGRRKAKVRRALAEAPSIDVLLREAGPRGVAPGAVGARLGLAPLPPGPLRFAEAVVEPRADALIERVRARVAEDPKGLPLDEARGRPVDEAAIARAIERGALVQEGAALRPSGHVVDESPAEALAERALEALRERGLKAPREHELADALDASEAELADALSLLEERDALVRSQGFCFAAEHLRPLRAEVAKAVVERGALPFKFLKQHGGLSRKHAMPLWTWLDRHGVTTRQGDRRVPGPAARKWAE